MNDLLIKDPVTSVFYAHEQIEGYYPFNYTSINLGTGHRFPRQVWTMRKSDFEALISRWNKVLPNTWKYAISND